MSKRKTPRYGHPTLTPSLHWIGFWHGWVRGGKLIEA